MTSMFVNEGGVAGHMSHLYDNPALTFEQIKKIFVAAAQGELEGTEKTDGQNLYISYSVKDGKAKAARNKGNIKQGGLDAAGLAAKFAGRGSVEEAFNDAFSVFEKAVQSLPAETQEMIFGPDANIYYNAEIQDPRNANVINYDTKNLTIHRVGHAYFNKETGNVENVDVSKSFQALQSALEKMQEAVAKEEFGVMLNPIRNLDKLSDETLNKNLAALEQAISRVGLSDNDTVLDYLVAKIGPMVKEKFSFLPEEAQNILTKRFATGKKSGEYSVSNLKSSVPAEQLQAFSRMVKEGDAKFRKAAVVPLEKVVHDFTVDVLEGLQSLFILDNSTEVARLKSEVATAIKAIETSGNEEAMEILKSQLEKLKTADRVTTAAEGFVFDWDGKTYKFTGNFAPINQILGLFKYGRGSIPAMQPLNEEEGEGKTTAVIAGGFKPPHRGHMEMVEYYADKADQVKIYTSKSKPREGITQEQSEELFNLYLKSAGLENKVEIIPDDNPLGMTFAYPEQLAEEGEHVIVGGSDKGGDFEKRYNEKSQDTIRSYAAERDVAVEFEPYLVSEDPVSATDFREAILSGKDISPFIPDEVNPEEVLEILKKEETLDEVSVGGGGAVAGFAGGLGKEDEKHTIYREMQENYFIKREDLMEEIKLRKAIRNILTEGKKKELNEERRLRKVIRRMLTEAKQANEVVYQNTGINKLRDLLRNIIPTIQDDYKDLTTSAAQREAFKNHLMIGVQNLLGIADISKNTENDPAANLELEEEIDVEVSDDPARMDLGFGKKEEPAPEPEDKRSEEEKLVSGDEMPTDPDQLTGMREAAMTLKKIQTQILNVYETLSNPEDEKAFKEYIVPNIDAHLKDFEGEITPAPEVEVEDPAGSVEVEPEVEEEPIVEDQIDLSEDLLQKLTNLL